MRLERTNSQKLDLPSMSISSETSVDQLSDMDIDEIGNPNGNVYTNAIETSALGDNQDEIGNPESNLSRDAIEGGDPDDLGLEELEEEEFEET